MCVTGFPAAAYAAYAAGRGYSGYPSFGLPYPTGNHLAAASLHHHNNHHTHPHSHHSHHPGSHPLATLLPPYHHPLEHLGVYAAAAAAGTLHAVPLWTFTW